MAVNTERCPLCGTELSAVKFREIQVTLRQQEEEKAAHLRRRIELECRLDFDKQKETLEKRVRQESEARVKQVSSERDQVAKKLAQAEASVAAIRKQVEDDAEKLRLKELAQQRRVLESDKISALQKQRAEYARKDESLQKKVQELERKLQNKTANELGDGAEIDLFEALRDQFSMDRIVRVPKGHPGADIVHEVLYKGSSCGRIVIDSKNRQDWHYSYVAKLRRDQAEAKAEHAILASAFFPKGKREMCIESDVIVVAPGRVVYIVQILRNAMITMHVKGLSMKERATKMSRLYDLITSDSYSRRFSEASKLADDVLELDVQEKRDHDNVWKKRGILAKRIQAVLREVETDVSAVIEATDSAEMPPGFSLRSSPSSTITSRAREIV